MADQKRVTGIMTLAEFYPPSEADGPPAMLLRTRSMTPGGSRRSVSMKVFVRDPELYRRLREQVSPGQSLRVTTETDWDALGEGTSLLAFEPLGVESAAAIAS